MQTTERWLASWKRIVELGRIAEQIEKKGAPEERAAAAERLVGYRRQLAELKAVARG